MPVGSIGERAARRADAGGGGRSAAGSSYWREPKFDGYRIGVLVEDSRARLVSRGDRSLTAAFATLASAVLVAAADRSMVLDGEVVAVGASGRPDFEALQARVRGRGTGAAGPALRLVLFDLLHLDGTTFSTRCCGGAGSYWRGWAWTRPPAWG